MTLRIVVVAQCEPLLVTVHIVILILFSESREEATYNCINNQTFRDDNKMADDNETSSDEPVYTFRTPEGSPSKRLKPNEVSGFRSSNDAQENLYINLVQGGFELIALEDRPDKDGFLNPLRKEVEANTIFSRRLNLKTIATRRAAPDDPEPAYNVVSGSPSNHTRKPPPNIPRALVVRMVNSSSKSTRKECLVGIASLLNKHHRENPPDQKYKMARQIWERNRLKDKVVIPADWDRTANSYDNLSRLDDHLTP